MSQFREIKARPCSSTSEIFSRLNTLRIILLRNAQVAWLLLPSLQLFFKSKEWYHDSSAEQITKNLFDRLSTHKNKYPRIRMFTIRGCFLTFCLRLLRAFSPFSSLRECLIRKKNKNHYNHNHAKKGTIIL